MATAIISVSSAPTYNKVKEQVHHILSTHSHSLPSVTENNNEDNTHGLTLTELCREYEHLYSNEHLPYQELGYTTLTRFLSSMKDVVRMDFSEWPARCYLRNKTNRQTDQHKNLFVGNTHPIRQQNNKKQVSNEFEIDSVVTYANVKKTIILLLKLSSQTNNDSSLTFTELCNQYSTRNNGQQLPYEQLGHPSLHSLLETMWDSVRVDNRRWYLINSKKSGIRKGKNTNKYREDRMVMREQLDAARCCRM